MTREQRALVRNRARAELAKRESVTSATLWRLTDVVRGKAVPQHSRRIGAVVMVPDPEAVPVDMRRRLPPGELAMIVEAANGRSFAAQSGDKAVVETDGKPAVFEVLGPIVRSARRPPYVQRHLVRRIL